MDVITFRILDALVEHHQQLEEIYLAVNYLSEDGLIRRYRKRMRLAELVVKLGTLEESGWVTSFSTLGYEAVADLAGKSFRMTKEGRRVWFEQATTKRNWYELAEP